MNKATVPSQRSFAFATDRPAEDETIDVQKIFLMARRQMKWILGCSALGLVLAFVFMYFSPPVYSSSSQILVDQNIGKVVGDVSTLPATIQTDAEILSNIEVLKSIRLALAVVDAENLADDPAFLNSPPSVARQLLQPVRDGMRILRDTAKSILEGNESETGPRVVAAAKDKRETAAERLRADLRAERVGRSFVINTTYKSHDPERAYRLLEATVRAFLVDQQLANIAASQVATNWMKVRLDELSDQSHEAGLAVERFRADNGLSIARGELVSEQRLSELNGQLVLAQSELGQVEARARQMDAIVSGGIEAATLNAVSAGATTQDAAVDALRTRYSGLSRRIESITARWGEDHAQAQSLRGERDNVARDLYAELQRIAAQYRSELSVAQNRVQALRDQTNAQTGSNASSNQLLVQLSGLEQKAESLKALYGSSLTRYEEALQRQSFPVSNLRVISPATQPQAPSEPRLVPTLAMFLLLGGLLGCGIGAMREFNDRHFRVGEDVRRLLGVRFGYLPRLKGFGGGGEDRIMHASLDRPNSSFTETLRKIRLNLNPEAGGSRFAGNRRNLNPSGRRKDDRCGQPRGLSRYNRRSDHPYRCRSPSSACQPGFGAAPAKRLGRCRAGTTLGRRRKGRRAHRAGGDAERVGQRGSARRQRPEFHRHGKTAGRTARGVRLRRPRFASYRARGGRSFDAAVDRRLRVGSAVGFNSHRAHQRHYPV